MITVNAQGSTFNFPDDTPPEEIQAAMAKAFPPAQAAPSTLPSPVDDPSYLGRMADKVGEGFSNAASSVAGGLRSGANEILDQSVDSNTGLMTSWGGAEGVTKGGADIVAGLAGGAIDAVGGIASGVAGEDLTNSVKSAFGDVMKSEPAQAVGDAMKAVGGAYDEFVEDKPMLKEMGSAVADATTIGTAFGVPKAKVSTGTHLGDRRIKALEEDVKKGRLDKVQDMLEPPDKKGLGTLDVDAKGNHIYIPSAFEKAVANEINQIKGLKTNAPLARNHNVLRGEAVKIREKLEKRIERAGDPAVDMAKLQRELEEMAQNITGMDGGFALVGDSKAAAENMLYKLSEILEDSKPTAMGVLEARRKFDKEVRRAYGNVFNPDKEQAKTIANKFIRDKLNDVVDEAMPNTDVLESLQRQHHLLYASDELLAKAFKERDTTIGRLVQTAENKMGLKIPTTPLALGTTAAVGAGVLAGAPAAAATAGGIAGLLGAYKGGAWLSSPAGRTWGWKLVRAIEQDPLASKALKTDRAALIEILEAARGGEEEE